MNEQQLKFLRDSLSFLETKFGHDDQVMFLENCLNQLHSTDRLSRSELSALQPMGKGYDPRTYVNWLDKFCKLLEEHENRLWDNYGESLQRFPRLTKKTGKGGGRQ